LGDQPTQQRSRDEAQTSADQSTRRAKQQKQSVKRKTKENQVRTTKGKELFVRGDCDSAPDDLASTAARDAEQFDGLQVDLDEWQDLQESMQDAMEQNLIAGNVGRKGKKVCFDLESSSERVFKVDEQESREKLLHWREVQKQRRNYLNFQRRIAGLTEKGWIEDEECPKVTQDQTEVFRQRRSIGRRRVHFDVDPPQTVEFPLDFQEATEKLEHWEMLKQEKRRFMKCRNELRARIHELQQRELWTEAIAAQLMERIYTAGEISTNYLSGLLAGDHEDWQPSFLNPRLPTQSNKNSILEKGKDAPCESSTPQVMHASAALTSCQIECVHPSQEQGPNIRKRRSF
jgi:hypothetical protein